MYRGQPCLIPHPSFCLSMSPAPVSEASTATHQPAPTHCRCQGGSQEPLSARHCGPKQVSLPFWFCLLLHGRAILRQCPAFPQEGHAAALTPQKAGPRLGLHSLPWIVQFQPCVRMPSESGSGMLAEQVSSARCGGDDDDSFPTLVFKSRCVRPVAPTGQC